MYKITNRSTCVYCVLYHDYMVKWLPKHPIFNYTTKATKSIKTSTSPYETICIQIKLAENT